MLIPIRIVILFIIWPVLFVSEVFGQQVDQSGIDVRNDSTLKTTYTSLEPRALTISLQGGGLNYPRIANIPLLNGVTGLALGFKVWRRFSVEAGFLYSFQQQDVEFLRSVPEDIDQYIWTAQLRYMLYKKSWVSLSPGFLMSYSYRSYMGGENSSSSQDVGASLGLDFPISSNWSLGVDYRFMMNVNYRRQFSGGPAFLGAVRSSSNQEVINLEETEYQLVLFSLKRSF